MMQKSSLLWAADRLGTSRIIKLVKQEEATGILITGPASGEMLNADEANKGV